MNALQEAGTLIRHFTGSGWLILVVLFIVRFVSCLLTEVQTVLVVKQRVRSAVLLSGVEDLFYWVSIGLVAAETSQGLGAVAAAIMAYMLATAIAASVNWAEKMPV